MYSDFEEKILKYCIEHKMFPRGKVLVALSGGGDSVALLHVLITLRGDFGIRIEAAHLNHSLRGEESDKDERFCRDLCNGLNIPLTVQRLKAGEILGDDGSIETVARESRLAFLQHVAAKGDIVRIATGHTLDDQTETILQRLIRGTGPSGLAGILPVRENLWVRPMLCAYREEVRDYLARMGILYREDSTNKDTSFSRNRIRYELLPHLAERFSPNIKGVLARMAELARIQEDYLDEKMVAAYKACLIHEDRFKILLDKNEFMDYHKVLKQRIVRHCLRVLEGAGRKTDREEIENILKLFTRKRGSADVTAKVKCGVEGRYCAFIVEARPVHSVPLHIPGETLIPMDGGIIYAGKSTDKIIVDGKSTITVCPHILEKFGDITVGTVKTGECIRPYGTNKTVKIRDMFSSVSLPKVLRDSLPVVRAGAVPIWIPGIRSSEYLRTDVMNTFPDNCILLQFKGGIQCNE